MSKYQADFIVVASIWPAKLGPYAMYHGKDPDPRSGRCTVYEIEAAKRYGKPPYKSIQVFDSFENVPDINRVQNKQGRTGFGFTSKPVLCEEIVQNLIQHWGGNMVNVPAGAAPGVMALSKGQDVPYEKDLDRMMAMQMAFAEHQFQQGERMAAERDWKGITATMRLMARWLGNERAWSTPESFSRTVSCAACRQPIPEDASVCHRCGTRLKALPAELAKLNTTPATA